MAPEGTGGGLTRARSTTDESAREEGAPGWHALPAADVLHRVDSSPSGLTTEEAGRRLATHGPNRLEPARPTSAWSVLRDQFASLVVLLLAAAAAAALVTGDHLEAGAIGIVLVINTAIGFVVELRARRAMEALLEYDVPSATVVRDGERRVVSASDLVPGDVVVVESGDAVPADARIVEASGIQVVEAALTGESVPVAKTEAPSPEDAPLADRTSMLHAGTTAATGRATAVVVGTGSGTELGRIGALMAEVEPERTPLERRLDDLGRRLVWLTLGIAVVVVALGAVRGVALPLMIETGIALAIAAVPEGLPAVATIALAVGLRRMATRNALVRKLSAVEALGSSTVVCADKTGTLTAGVMTVTRVVAADFGAEVTGSGLAGTGRIAIDGADDGGDALERLLHCAALTGTATVDPESGEVRGDPTDVALLLLARKGGVERDALTDALPRLLEVPFSTATMVGASFHRTAEGTACYVKGAPGAVLERCTHLATSEGPVPMDAERRARLEGENEALAARGLRVIALAWGPPPHPPPALEDLTFLGLVGITDPPAEGVPETIERLRGAGVRTVMITGDQKATAAAIGRELGILSAGGRILDGRDLGRLNAARLSAEVREVDAFSRVSPEDKLKIVTALQEQGEIVAMLGDGVNDAAALKKSDVGVTMGRRGTDLARETASIVLQDDRFATIGVAVEQGRVIFENIRKFVFYLFSCNLAEVMVLLVAGVAGLPLPLLPLQILWLNLVTDTFPALALAMEPGEPDVMRRPPRDPERAILSRSFVTSLFFFALLITVVTLSAYLRWLEPGGYERAVTAAFMTLGLAQLFHLGNARSRGPVLKPRAAFANPWAVGAVPLVVGLQILAVEWAPLRRALGTVRLSATEWATVVALSLVPAIVGQTIEVVQRRRARGSRRAAG